MKQPGFVLVIFIWIVNVDRVIIINVSVKILSNYWGSKNIVFVINMNFSIITVNFKTDFHCALLFFTGLISLATGGPSANVVGLPMGPGVRMDPYFMDDQPIRKNLTLLTGQTAYLECNVRNLGANKVILR
jgi:hypothetical protein